MPIPLPLPTGVGRGSNSNDSNVNSNSSLVGDRELYHDVDDQDAFDVSTSFRQKVLPDLTSSPLFICTQRTRTRITNERVVLQLTFEETKRP